MEFNTEAELVKLIIESGQCIPKTGGWRTPGYIPEFDGSFGRADLVFYDLRCDWKTALPLGRIYPKWAYALRSLPYRKAFSTDGFLNLTGTSKKLGFIALN